MDFVLTFSNLCSQNRIKNNIIFDNYYHVYTVIFIKALYKLIAKMVMIKAIIFDMDGTLVDSIPFHKDAWLHFLKKHGIILAPEELDLNQINNL